MAEVTTALPPYLPSLAWWRGEEVPDRRRFGRWLSRTLIESNTPGGQVLTVPVAGGAGEVKHGDPRGFLISSHGDWTRIHLGAIEAAYGREPYFQHFFPQLAGIIAGYPPELVRLNRDLIDAVLRMTDFEREIDGIRAVREERPERFRAIESRLLAGVDPRHSVIEPLFRYGRDLLFLISEPHTGLEKS